MKLAILTPSCRNPEWEYVKSVLAMEEYIRSNGVLGAKIEFMGRLPLWQNSLLPQGRQILHDGAIELGMTHALWLDDDMEVPHNLMDYLARHFDTPIDDSPSNPKYPGIIGANYVRKDERAMYTAVKGGAVISSDPPNTGLQEVDDCAMGCMLVDLEAVKHIRPPHFEILWDKKLETYRGEDRYFCNKMARAGVRVYIDHDVSRLVEHIGTCRYGYKMRKQAEVSCAIPK